MSERKPIQRYTTEELHPLRSAIYDSAKRAEIQAAIHKNHIKAINALVDQFGIQYGSVRNQLEKAKYEVPSRKKRRKKPEPDLFMPPEPGTLRERIQRAINCSSAENESDTPDFILAEYLTDCLQAFDKAVNARRKWHGIEVPRTPVSRPMPITPPPASNETQESH